tara:strand:+ start:1361 stop:1906 length:546 start_codon:yes stop_codon:yes gene_type:complete
MITCQSSEPGGSSSDEHQQYQQPDVPSLSSQSLHVRCLGWRIARTSCNELYPLLCTAIANLGVASLSCDPTTYSIHCSSLDRDASEDSSVGFGASDRMTALIWIAADAGGHHICIRRASGDTFAYHSFYRQVRQAMAQCTGWVEAENSYRIAAQNADASPEIEAPPSSASSSEPDTDIMEG